MTSKENFLKWKIYYSDGSFFTNKDGNPEDAPGRGVQIILQRDDMIGREVLRATDFYVWKDNKWYAMEYFGFVDYLIQPGLKIVKLGEYITNEEYRRLLGLAINDDGFPKKSGSYNHEGVTD